VFTISYLPSLATEATFFFFPFFKLCCTFSFLFGVPLFFFFRWGFRRYNGIETLTEREAFALGWVSASWGFEGL
jgi:hypothetical protein